MTEKNIISYFQYILKEDYDREMRINNEKVMLYSQKKLDELYPRKDYTICGEILEGEKRNTDEELGCIRLADKLLYVTLPGTHSRLLFRTYAYAASDGGYIAMLKPRLVP